MSLVLMVLLATGQAIYMDDPLPEFRAEIAKLKEENSRLRAKVDQEVPKLEKPFHRDGKWHQKFGAFTLEVPPPQAANVTADGGLNGRYVRTVSGDFEWVRDVPLPPSPWPNDAGQLDAAAEEKQREALQRTIEFSPVMVQVQTPPSAQQVYAERMLQLIDQQIEEIKQRREARRQEYDEKRKQIDRDFSRVTKLPPPRPSDLQTQTMIEWKGPGEWKLHTFPATDPTPGAQVWSWHTDPDPPPVPPGAQELWQRGHRSIKFRR